jgi:hypothetical protein
MVIYNPIHHSIMKLKQIWINKLLIKIHFHIAMALSQCYNNNKKDYEGLDLMVFYPWNFAHVKKQSWKKIFFTKILNFFSSCEVHIKCF